MDILFVDDSDLVRREVGARLRELPAVGRIVCRASVSDARRALEEASFDLWVLDFQLQDGTALDLLRCRREGPEPSRSGVVVFTSHATPLVRDRCLQAGADHFFDKADGVEEMMAAIEAIGPAPTPPDPGIPPAPPGFGPRSAAFPRRPSLPPASGAGPPSVGRSPWAAAGETDRRFRPGPISGRPGSGHSSGRMTAGSPAGRDGGSRARETRETRTRTDEMMNVEELLLIEDNRADARLVKEYLSEANGNGLSVRWEERLGSGLDVLRNGGADCVLLDLGLPDSQGVEAVGRVVEMAGAAPVVVLTGLDDEKTAVRAVQSGADDYLRKDEMTPTALQRAVRYARERRRLQAAVREQADRLEDILNTVSEGVLVVGTDLEIRFANPAAARILGVDRDELQRRDYDDSAWSVRTLECEELPEGCRPVEHALRSGHRVEDVEVALVRPDGREQVLSVNAAPLTSGPEDAGGAVISIRDVTERNRHEEELRHRALHDTLTGLPNRALFHDRLEHVLASVPRTGETVAVLFLDIDRFKVINDSLGHEAGDRLLEQIGERLAASVRDSDTVARMGGDEFTVLLEGIPDESVVEKRAERILAALEAPMTLGSQEIHVEVSMGIALYDHLEAEEGLSETDALIARADEAMFRAKEAPGTRYRFGSSTPDPGAVSQLRIETKLRSALEGGGIETHYQPLFDLASGRVVGLEALARWDDPELGPVSPGRFIPLAEQTGLIVELGRQQLRRAGRQVAEWSRRHPGASDLRLHVNLSLGELDDPDVVRHLREALEETELSAEQLWLEITESVTMRQPDRLRELSALGPRLTVDDFGTRYSTLTQLKRLNLSGLKVDRSFVNGVAEDPQDLAIVESVVTLGHRLGFEVVAEGIETEEQLHLLKEMGCDHGQGFLLGRPMPASGVSRLLRRSPPAPEESTASVRPDRSSRQRMSRTG